jgi:hypothetical protein
MVHEVISIRFDDTNFENKCGFPFYLYKMRFGLGKIKEKLFNSPENKGCGYIRNGLSLLGKKSLASVACTVTRLPPRLASNLGLISDSSKRIVF